MARDNEITSQICRDELLGLLNTMTPFEQQRITAEIVAPTVDVGAVAEPEPTSREPTMSEPSFSIRFVTPTPAAMAPTPARAPAISAEPQQRMSSLAIALTSFGVTLAIGALVIMAA